MRQFKNEELIARNNAEILHKEITNLEETKKKYKKEIQSLEMEIQMYKTQRKEEVLYVLFSIYCDFRLLRWNNYMTNINERDWRRMIRLILSDRNS